MTSRRLHGPPDKQQIHRLTTLFSLNKGMMERRANNEPEGRRQAEDDAVHSIIGHMCSDVHSGHDPSRIAGNDLGIADLMSALLGARLQGIDSYALLDRAAKAQELRGLIVGCEADADPIHVQEVRPYLYTPIRTLAALETLLDIWSDKGMRVWSCAISHSVRYLRHMSQGDDKRRSSQKAWEGTRHGRHVSTANGLMFMHLADRFEEAVKEGITIPEDALEDSLWFLGNGDREHIAYNMEYIRNTLLQIGPMHNREVW